MLLEATDQQIRYRFGEGQEIVLKPGVPVEVPDEPAKKLLKKAGKKVRQLKPKLELMPALSESKPIYWEDVKGELCGPAYPEFLAKVGMEFWLCVTYQGAVRFIHDSRVRARPSHPPCPIQVGWLVVWRDNGRLRGGDDDRPAGTVQNKEWTGSTWLLIVSDGRKVPLEKVTAVSRLDDQGQIVSSWSVREHGYGGHEVGT